jgi:hypothetical protein
MREIIADVFENIIDRQEALQKLPDADGPAGKK